ncbi:hypothetical protein MKX79_03695 [Viridibacillus sp. FSL R5-0468]|uniref:hypothetical protein n=1 Tax=Viridibacillus sp. FSL R5-0468 TaxID=2921640 RepID=UPI0030F79FB1
MFESISNTDLSVITQNITCELKKRRELANVSELEMEVEETMHSLHSDGAL